ncbi:MAG: acetyl-CoA hydrolase/transferase C-terminal domain-containing protein [Parvibaculum sp.]|nr:acetyl-CoA hydrolase/transferase C-terminal domain-containing protein [Parvibaculum sp.]
MSAAPFTNADKIVDAIIAGAGKDIVLGLPLGLGKANTIVNALYARAVADPTINLKIFTALTPEVPRASGDLERRFLEPFAKRVFGNYPALAYARDQRAGKLPVNVEVSEFFFLAGRWLSTPSAQQNYISANYTHASRYLIDQGVNVITQLVAKKGERYSLSCNTDMTLDLLDARTRGKAKFMLVGEVNSELPFMPGPGDLPSDVFAHMLDNPATDFNLFSAPKEPVSLTEYAIGIHVARLIPDGGTLQIGIGKQADALVHALTLRQNKNDLFRRAGAKLGSSAHEDAPFVEGLYGVSEMFVDGFLTLIKAGILKREVDGALLHAAFFLGPRAFYKTLREMDASSLAKLQMSAVSFTNDLLGDEATKRRHRMKARFVNNTMMATLLGAVVSDALEDGRVVSGVGGQYNFVAQGFELEGARSVITLSSTRVAQGKLVSNILWSYGHQTVPRHLRDVIVTEYGVADLRGKSDADVIAAMLAITDSHFQSELLAQAKAAKKIASDYEIPEAHRHNTPEHIADALAELAAQGHLPVFPSGTDFTDVEQRLLPALQVLKSAKPVQLIALVARGLFSKPTSADVECLVRLDLAAPRNMKERFTGWLVAGALKPLL